MYKKIFSIGIFSLMFCASHILSTNVAQARPKQVAVRYEVLLLKDADHKWKKVPHEYQVDFSVSVSHDKCIKRSGGHENQELPKSDCSGRIIQSRMHQQFGELCQYNDKHQRLQNADGIACDCFQERLSPQRFQDFREKLQGAAHYGAWSNTTAGNADQVEISAEKCVARFPSAYQESAKSIIDQVYSELDMRE